MKTKISASILSADFGHLADELSRAESAGCDMIHFDVMDGHFVPNISYGVPVLKSIRRYSRLPFDVHLMISDPNSYIEPFAKAGADGITFHLEASANPVGIIDKIHSLGLRAGVSVKPKTDVSLLYPLVGIMDMALIMTVEPGFGGQGFIPETLAKIKALRDYADSTGIALDIEVDGGISDKTAHSVREAGANVLVSGSYLFRAEDMAKNCKLLKD
ncbi:MAG: ribulose-phosphate 3-epimerase [Oscillospiraceae bacterium]|nr:ribulose-phosphate 3-epimerase [Oscillospiraceae bacterium]